MATIGQQLTAPESGWQRVDERDSNIDFYLGTWNTQSNSSAYNSTRTYSNDNPKGVRFNFSGTQIRIIGGHASNRSSSIKITIDGVDETFSQNNGNVSVSYQFLSYEKTGLTDSTHVVEIYDSTGDYVDIDAIDIDSTGRLLSYAIPVYKVLIKDGADYKYHNGISWQIATSVTPAEQDYMDYGMDITTLSSITEAQWNELSNPEISYYTDDQSKTSIAITVETNPFTLGEALGDNPTFHFYTDDPNKQPILETDTDEFGFYDEMGSSMDILYYTDDASVTSPQVEFEANYTPLDEISEDFDIVTWTNKPKEEVVETLTTTQSGTLTDGDTYSVSVDLTKGNGVKKIDEV